MKTKVYTPIFKRSDLQLLSNYSPTDVLLVSKKMFKKSSAFHVCTLLKKDTMYSLKGRLAFQTTAQLTTH